MLSQSVSCPYCNGRIRPDYIHTGGNLDIQLRPNITAHAILLGHTISYGISNNLQVISRLAVKRNTNNRYAKDAA